MTDWLTRVPSVNAIYFVPLEVAACFVVVVFSHYSGIGSMKFITNRDSSDPSSLSSLLDHPLICFGFCLFVLPRLQQLRSPRSRWPLIGSVEIEVLSDWSSVCFGFVHRSGGSGQPPAGCVTRTDSATADASGAQELSALQTQRLQSAQPLSQLQYGESNIWHKKKTCIKYCCQFILKSLLKLLWRTYY